MLKPGSVPTSTVFSLFAAIIVVFGLAFTPAASGKITGGGPLYDVPVRGSRDNLRSLGVGRFPMPERKDRNVLIPERDSLFESALTLSPSSTAASANLVISQVYGNGGNAGAEFSHDFIELFNRGSLPVNVSGWSVQYAAGGSPTWTEITALPNVSIPAGGYFLIQQASGNSGGNPLPAPDAMGSINLAFDTGKVALVNNTSTLLGSCPTGGGIVDFLGYGTLANCSEGVRTANATATTATIRRSNGCVDNDLNRDDFVIGAPTPRNSVSSANECLGPSIGGRIAFASDRSGNPDIYIMNADGSGPTRLTTDPGIEDFPSLSPDGSKIVFTRDSRIYVMNSDGTGQNALTSFPTDAEPKFSPDSSKIVFTSFRDNTLEIYVMNANGSNPTRLTNNSAADFSPIFSPDGQKIAFTSERDGQYEVYIMDADGTDQTRLTTSTNGRDSLNPTFSPDGARIAFESARIGNKARIFIMNADGSNQTQLTFTSPSSLDENDIAPSFSPDGTSIAFYTSRHGNFEIYSINSDGTNQTNLTNFPSANEYSPSWGVVAGALAVTEVNSSVANGTFGTGAVIPVQVTFGAPVVVTGTPTLRLATGGAGTLVNYTGGSGSAVLTFTYTVGAGHTSADLDYSSSAALALNGGTINSSGGTPVNLALPTPGTAGSLGFNKNIVIDTAVLDTTINTGPSGTVASTSATFTFSSNKPGATFQCLLDGAAFADCTSPITYNGLSQGPHTFQVRARDLAMNDDTTPASRTWTIDTAVPETTINSGPSGVTVPSSSATFTFSSNEAAATFQCSLNGGTFTSCTSPITYNGLDDGAQTFAVRAIDLAGNQDPSPATSSWTVDTNAPDTTITSGPGQNSTVPSTSIMFAFNSTEAGVTFQCQLDGGGFSSCTSPITYNNLSQGPHNFQVKAIDGLGNSDPTPATRTWTVDSIAPETTIVTGPANNSFVSSTSATFTFSSNETPATFFCSLNGGAFSPCTSPATYNGLGEGARSFGVRAVDAVGNQDASPATRMWTIDTTLPETTIFVGPTGAVNTTSATFQFSSSEGGATFQCQLDGGAYSACSSPTAYNSLGQGPHTFNVRAVDLAGNIDTTPASRSWTVDTNPPDTTIDSGPANNSFASSTSVTFTFSSNEANVTFLCSINGGVYSPCTSPATFNGLSEGARSFGVRAVDAAGNQDGSPATRIWTIDATPPDTIISVGPTGTVNTTSASFEFSSTEGAGGTFQCQLDGSAFAPCPSPVAYHALGQGMHTFTVRAVDQAGNVDPTPAVRQWTVDSPTVRKNHALAANGGIALGSTELSPASNANDGNRVWAAGGSWKDSTPGTFPDTLQVTFAGTKTVDEISVFAVKDDYANTTPPDMTTTTSLYSLVAFEAQYWTGSAWATIPGGSITGNNKAWVRITFAPLSTSRVRVVVNNASADGYSRIAELEAWGNEAGSPPPTPTPTPAASVTPTPTPTVTPTATPSPTPPPGARTNYALAANGGVATGSTELNAAANANDGSRAWAVGGAWKDSTGGAFPDTLTVNFNGTKSIDEISVFAVRDDYTNTTPPDETTTTTQYSLISFVVQYWNGSAWVTVPGGTITNNNKAWVKILFSPISTNAVRVVVNNASVDGFSRIAELEAWGGGGGPVPTPTPTPTPTPSPSPSVVPSPSPSVSPTPPGARTNHALAANGGVATGSTELNAAANANDGSRAWALGGAWKDSTGGAFPDMLTVNFNGTKSIDEISVFAVRDDYTNTTPPDETTTTTQYSLISFVVQYWNGSAWVTVPGGTFTNNNKAWVKILFAPVSTNAVRVVVNNASVDGFSRIVELEAWGGGSVPTPTPTPTPTPSPSPSAVPSPSPSVSPTPPMVRVNHALATNGGSAAGTTELNPASSAIDGSRVWSIGGAWKDSTPGVFPDVLTVTFNGTKSIDEISLFAVRDDFSNTTPPDMTTTTTQYSLINFEVQYWTGTAWVTVPGGTVTGNNLAWRKFTFAPISTTRIRVIVNNASADGYSRVAELEAWGDVPS